MCKQHLFILSGVGPRPAPDNSLHVLNAAATQFGLLLCASDLPITYMHLVDGHAYGAGGLTWIGLGLLACALMSGLLTLWARRKHGERQRARAS